MKAQFSAPHKYCISFSRCGDSPPLWNFGRPEMDSDIPKLRRVAALQSLALQRPLGVAKVRGARELT
jgi:hypothetical protein